ncbi:protein DpdE [Nocardia cyriacigeorgica]|uniref:protein DpdE n=1 Tax=Nocardia cyriacigeorgica TaxID=135487 RepID=UPI002B4AF283|nr:protein DpdE [Nocardia cyriacigeorgica]
MSDAVGVLVTFDGAPGIGRVAAVRGDRARVDFFESAAEPVVESQWVSVEGLRRVRLDKETRVFVPKNDGGWLAGRVIGGKSSTYYVRFPNQTVDIEVPEYALRVRRELPVSDPLQVLISEANETPRYRDARQPVRDALLADRASSMSATGISSSGVKIHAHQVSAALRIINDPVQRYLLADEVGMGKTIQAGFVIRQMLLDDRSRRVGLIVPSALREQWRGELLEKFYLDDFATSDGRLPFAIRSHEQPDEWHKFATADMLVVDEAHLLARVDSPDEAPYHLLAEVARVVPRILLISATPFGRRATTHLALLHLLDPVHFRWEGREQFERLLESRVELAEVITGLEDPDPEDPEDVEYFYDRLRELLPQDELLETAMADSMSTFSEGTAADEDAFLRSVVVVRTHVAETYRLHHRVVRNRRHTVQRQRLDDEGTMTPFEFTGRGRPNVLRLDTVEGALVVGVVDDWLRRTADYILDHGIESAPFARVVGMLVSRLGAATAGDMADVVEARVSGRNIGEFSPSEMAFLRSAPPLPFEEALLERLRQSELGDGPRILAADILRRIKPNQRTVVFCGKGRLADALAAQLKSLGQDSVPILEHFAQALAEARQQAVDAWQTAGGVLVADESGDVGRNFQQADVVFHARVPWNPNQLEQRIGRVDRYGTNRTAGQWVVSDPDRDGIHTAWLKVLADGFSIFDESISSVQDIVEELAEDVWLSVLDEGREAAAEKATEIPSRLQAERSRINRLDALEASYGDSASDMLSKRIAQYDARHDTIESAFKHLLTSAGGFALAARQNSDGSTMFERDELQSPLVSPRLLLRLSTRPESRTGYFDRWRVKSGRRLFRRGNPFVDGVESILAIDDRGQATAQWRLDRTWQYDPLVYFGFEFLVEADLDPLLRVFHEGTKAVSVARRRGDLALRPQYWKVWVDVSTMAPVKDANTIRYLDQPCRDGRDTNLNPSRMGALHSVLGGPTVFGTIAPQCLDIAQSHLRSVAELARTTEEAAKHVALQTDAIVAQSKARYRAAGLVPDVDLLAGEIEAGRALERGVRRPRIHLASVSCLVRSLQSWAEYA